MDVTKDMPAIDVPTEESNNMLVDEDVRQDDNPAMNMDDDSSLAMTMPLDLSVKKKESAAEPTEQPLQVVNTSSRAEVKFMALDLSEKLPVSSVIQTSATLRRSTVHVFQSDLAAIPAPRVYRAPDVSPLIADHASLDEYNATPDEYNATPDEHNATPDEHNATPAAPEAETALETSATAFRPYSEYKSSLIPAFADAQMPLLPPLTPMMFSLPPLPPLLPPLSALTTAVPLPCSLLQDTFSPSLQYRQHLQQQQRQLQQHQQQLQLQQEHQFQLQQQQHLHFQLQQQIQRQQQQLATYTGGVDTFQLSNPLQYASESPMSSVSDSNHFQFGTVNCGIPKTACVIERSYLDERETRGDEGFSSSGQSDCPSPDWSVEGIAERRRIYRILTEEPHFEPEEMAEEIAAIYRQADFILFRQRYLDSLGPPKNFEKMRRSVPSKRIAGGGSDHMYVMKRQKNNEAAKRSRDAKRQKYIENQISVLYLTKKVNEMKEIKRRLLMSL